MSAAPLLSVSELQVSTAQGQQLVKSLSFELYAGESLALVGESGSGKTLSALSLIQLLPQPQVQHSGGEIRFAGQPISREQLQALRGGDISIIFQDPMTALNPVHRVIDQITEVISLHRQRFDGSMDSPAARRAEAIRLLERVGINRAAERAEDYPHKFSGGMRQRVMIAMALACRPTLLIADEPTTALDVTVQADIMALIRDLQSEYQMALLFITHDLSLVAETCERVLVMRLGELVEQGSCAQVFGQPQHPYTQQLLAALPHSERPRKSRIGSSAEAATNTKHTQYEQILALHNSAQSSEPLIRIRGLEQRFQTKRQWFGPRPEPVVALNGVDLDIYPGETLGLVGESGSGKSSLGKALLQLQRADSGSVLYRGQDLCTLSDRAMRPLRQQLQIIFQDPMDSMNPRLSAAEVIAEPLIIHKLGDAAQRQQRVEALLERVGLNASDGNKYPHEFSGGQRQRIGIARAIALEPEFIACDESVSALDVSVQAQILNLLLELQRDMGLTLLFISHDLAVVRHMSDRIAVMQGGEILELGDADAICSQPQHPYTQRLLAAKPADLQLLAN